MTVTLLYFELGESENSPCKYVIFFFNKRYYGFQKVPFYFYQNYILSSQIIWCITSLIYQRFIKSWGDGSVSKMIVLQTMGNPWNPIAGDAEKGEIHGAFRPASLAWDSEEALHRQRREWSWSWMLLSRGLWVLNKSQASTFCNEENSLVSLTACD